MFKKLFPVVNKEITIDGKEIKDIYTCPKCGSIISLNDKRCISCNQRIKWNKDNYK